MIHIANFDQIFVGRKFKDVSHIATPQPEYECIGYGDNQGNPYLVGMNDKFELRTVLLKHVVFINLT